jgi:hypothetical protein
LEKIASVEYAVGFVVYSPCKGDRNINRVVGIAYIVRCHEHTANGGIAMYFQFLEGITYHASPEQLKEQDDHIREIETMGDGESD